MIDDFQTPAADAALEQEILAFLNELAVGYTLKMACSRVGKSLKTGKNWLYGLSLKSSDVQCLDANQRLERVRLYLEFRRKYMKQNKNRSWLPTETYLIIMRRWKPGLGYRLSKSNS
jgi:hypothetical protein